MALTPGTRIGPYEVGTLLGVGGMGEVYQATDTQLKRSVALKVLPAAVAADSDRLARFRREAQVLASLNHQNIAQIHGLETSDGATTLVMELVEGPTLADRVAQGALPVDEVVPIARQIADALEAAHEQTVVHRDLKPANVKVRADGMVKVLDFGLAKALEPGGISGTGPHAGHADTSLMPTLTTPAMTQAGMLLGTAAYMSPEQARGRPVDRRADIWAFGTLVFELLTARRAFPGDTITDTIVSVVSKEPDWSALPADVPARLRMLLRRCLDKEPRRRLRDIGEARLTLEDADIADALPTATPAAAGPATTPAPRASRGVMAALAIGGLAIVGLTGPAMRHLLESPAPTPRETRLDIATRPSDEPSSFALSPDGGQIVFTASRDGVSRLWLRLLASTTAQPLPGTEGGMMPFWSPDGQAIGFFADGALKRLDVGSAPGTARVLAQVTNGAGGSWGADGVILFAPSVTTPVMRVAASGGPAAPVTTFGPQHSGHAKPHFLPDGRRFLFHVFGAAEISGIYVGGLDGRAPARLTPSDGGGLFAPDAAGSDSGWLLWVREGSLVAQRADLERVALTGEPVTISPDVAADRRFHVPVSTARGGLIAYRTGGANPRQLTWVDRTGAPRGTVGSPDRTLANPQVSPDGGRVVVTRESQGNYDLWLMDGPRTSRLTFDAAREDFGTWSADGTRVFFRSNRRGPFDLYQMPASGGDQSRLVGSNQLKVPSSTTRDGRFLMYSSIDPQTDLDIWVLSLEGDPSPRVFLRAPFRELWGDFSPDGHWVACQSNESGRPEIYVRPFVAQDASRANAPSDARWQVSTAGGIMPAWSPDGREIFYLDPAGAMTAVPVAVRGEAVELGTPVRLFPTTIFGGGVDAQQGRQYDVARDGRFLINQELRGDTPPITLLTNWAPEARR